MTEIPVEVQCDEVIVRGLCHPYHYRDGKLNWNAFRPPPGRNDVSVIRHDFTGVDFCRRKGRELSDPAKNKRYCGLAFFRAGAVRAAGADVVDTRAVYLGHADVMHAIPATPKGEPLPGPQLDALREICKSIIARSKYVADDDAEGTPWPHDHVDVPSCVP